MNPVPPTPQAQAHADDADDNSGWNLDRLLRRDRRKRRRKHLRGFKCRYGELVDFSERGFGLVHQRDANGTPPKPGDRVDLVLTYAGQNHRVEAEVVRVAELNTKCSDVGLRLVAARPETRDWLAMLARRGETIGAGPQAWVPQTA